MPPSSIAEEHHNYERSGAAFASYGALCGLPDIEIWAENVARLVAPGGIVYLVDFHPFVWSLADDTPEDRPTMSYRYLSHSEPSFFASGTDYLDEGRRLPRTTIGTTASDRS